MSAPHPDPHEQHQFTGPDYHWDPSQYPQDPHDEVYDHAADLYRDFPAPPRD
jgi:hypothetical protein